MKPGGLLRAFVEFVVLWRWEDEFIDFRISTSVSG